ncbi:MAG TPA: transposase [Spirochaetia bacterium]|nr:transposase [Spirochaetia bacterium]
MARKTVQKVKKKEKTGNEQYKSVVIAVPKSLVNQSNMDELYEVDRRHARAVNEWIGDWYWRLDMVERILTGSATAAMQKENIETPVLSAYAQIAGNRMLDILREHYLAIQDKLAADIWRINCLSPEYQLVYAVMARNHTLFARFISGDFCMADVVARWADSDSEYLRRAAETYNRLTRAQRWGIPVKIFHAFRETRWRWSKPWFKGGSILLDYRVFSVAESENTVKFNLWVNMAGNVPFKRINVPFQLIGGKKEILESLFPGWRDTNQRKALLIIRGRHIHISVPVAKEKQANAACAEVIGCDVGMTTPLSLSNGKQYGKSFSELVRKEYDKYLKLQETRNKFRALKTKTEKRLETCTDTEEQARLLKRVNEYLRHLSDHRWNQMRRRIKAVVSTEIGRAVNLLIRDMGNLSDSRVVLEDLAEMSTQRAKRSTKGRFDLSVWARGELQDHLREDLEWLGGSVDYVVPAYSSQECSKCGCVDKENRSGKVFKCKRCGHTEDADINAAKNIRKRFSDAELREIARKYSWNKELRRKKVLELLSLRANQAA